MPLRRRSLGGKFVCGLGNTSKQGGRREYIRICEYDTRATVLAKLEEQLFNPRFRFNEISTRVIFSGSILDVGA